jgi:hypothetical protein
MKVASFDTALRAVGSSRLSATWLPLFITVIAVVAFSTNEYQIFYQIHSGTGKELIDASNGVLTGHPPWRAFQARLLGPLAFAAFGAAVEWVQTLSPLTYSAFERVFSSPGTRDLAALNGFVAAMILAKNFVCFALLFQYCRSFVKAAGGTILGSVLFVFLSNHWLYMWDLFELVFFCFLASTLYKGNRLGVGFFVVYILSLTNRESAAFFGVWLLCYATAHRLINGRFRWREATIGIVLVAVAVFYVMMLRQALLVESTIGHETGVLGTSNLVTAHGRNIHQAFGSHLLILTNVKEFFKNLVSTYFYVDVFVIVLVLHGLILSRLGIVRRNARLLAIGAFNLILLASILNFALLNETRLFLICIPFLVFSAVAFFGDIAAFFERIDRQSVTFPARRGF